MGTSSLLLQLVIFAVTWSVVQSQILPTSTYTWGAWGTWGTCHGTCPSTYGYNTRTRQCIHVTTTGNTTTTAVTATSRCGSVDARIANSTCLLQCPVDGHWGSWSDWGSCSVTMGTGHSTRQRSCNNPSPSYGGRPCSGDNSQETECSKNVWSTWQAWSSCSVSCGNGTITRHRTCVSGTLCYDSRPGNGYVEVSGCLKTNCTLDGGWGAWSPWSRCSATCDFGITIKTRRCDTPSPQLGGANCTGPEVDRRACWETGCPIDGGWSNWTHETQCSATCDYGVAFATRTCTNPPPQHGGRDCQGPTTSFEKCTVRKCYEDGNWSKWSELTPCEAICGTGLQRTLRTCTDPVPRGGGRECEGVNMLSRECNANPCPSDIKVCDGVRLQETLTTATAPDLSCGNTSGSMRLLFDFCSAPSTDDWILGALVHENCGRLPLYTPVASVDEVTGSKRHGILLDCYREVLTLATLDCGGSIQKHEQDLRMNETVFHLITW